MKTMRPHATTRIRIAAIAFAALALLVPAASTVTAAGLRNCVDVTGPALGRAGCWEDVWADGVQHRMTFSNQAFAGATPADRIAPFYVLAPQAGAVQGALPFPHDHVVGGVPAQNHGDYRVVYHGYFVMCSEHGLITGGCTPTMTSIDGFGVVPFARLADGRALTSSDRIEAAADAGLVILFDTGGVIVGTISGR